MNQRVAQDHGCTAETFQVAPLWDVACTICDLNTYSKSGSSRTSQIINAVLGVAAAIGIGLTVFKTPIYAVAIFGLWAFGAPDSLPLRSSKKTPTQSIIEMRRLGNKMAQCW